MRNNGNNEPEVKKPADTDNQAGENTGADTTGSNTTGNTEDKGVAVVINPAPDATAIVTPASGQTPLVPEAAPGAPTPVDHVPPPTQVPRLSASTVPVASVVPQTVSGGPEASPVVASTGSVPQSEMVSISREEFDAHLLRLRRIASDIRETRPGPYELPRFADSMDSTINSLAGGVQ